MNLHPALKAIPRPFSFALLATCALIFLGCTSGGGQSPIDATLGVSDADLLADAERQLHLPI